MPASFDETARRATSPSVALKKQLLAWFPWLRQDRHLLRVMQARWWNNRQEMMDTAHITKEWDFELPLERERHARILSVISELHPGPKSLHALEVGCAEGLFTRKLAARCASVVACDISPVACARAAKRCADLPNVIVRKLDIAREPVSDRFDWVFAMDVLYYVHGRDHLRKAIDNLTKALTQGGHLIVCECRLPEHLRDAWWMRWFPEGADAVMECITRYSGLELVHREFHPADGTHVPDYMDHIFAFFKHRS